MVVLRISIKEKKMVLSKLGLEVCLWQVSVTRFFSSEKKVGDYLKH